MIDWHQKVHQSIRDLSPYQPGKSTEELFLERGISDAVKLASNENPLGCSPRVLSALAALPCKNIAIYPNAFSHPLKSKIAKQCGLSLNQILLANGSDSIFTLIFTLFCLQQQKHVLTHQQCFPSYPIQAKTFGIPIKQIPLDEQWHWTVSSFISSCSDETGVIIFANPNNPTGVKIKQGEIKKLLQAIPEAVVVVVDEAYYEYGFKDSSESALPLLNQFSNLIITRSFSKAYGLAGLRLGYAMANEKIIDLVWRIQQPFAVNGLALHCGEIAWEDQEFIDKSLKVNSEGLAYVTREIEELGYQYIPSFTNFVTMDVGGKAQALNEHLLDQGIIVRPLVASGMPFHLRVSIGTRNQNERFLAALKQFAR